MNKFRDLLFRMFNGCYGIDKLNMAITYADVALCIVNLFARSILINSLVWILLLVVIFRMFSKQRYKRYEENRRYLQFLDRMRDRNNRYFKCPKCRQMVRVPRGKGKIAISCPKCANRFIKKT